MLAVRNKCRGLNGKVRVGIWVEDTHLIGWVSIMRSLLALELFLRQFMIVWNKFGCVVWNWLAATVACLSRKLGYGDTIWLKASRLLILLKML